MKMGLSQFDHSVKFIMLHCVYKKSLTPASGETDLEFLFTLVGLKIVLNGIQRMIVYCCYYFHINFCIIFWNFAN